MGNAAYIIFIMWNSIFGLEPSIVEWLKNEDDLKKEDNLKNEGNLKNEDDLKNEDNLKN